MKRILVLFPITLALAFAQTGLYLTGTGNVAVTTGTGSPSGVCASQLCVYIDTTTPATPVKWFSYNGSSVWSKDLSTLNTGSYVATGQTSSSTPTAPASGSASLFFNTSSVAQTENSVGAIASTSVVPGTGATANQWMTYIDNTGATHTSQPAFSNLSGTATSAQLPTATVFNNQANTYSAGLQDLSAATAKLPSSAAYAPTTAGLFGYDTTNNRITWGNGTQTNNTAWWTGTAPTSGNCVKWAANGQLQDQGAACGTSTGGSGTVNSATVGQTAYYAAAGTAVSGVGPGTSKQMYISGGTGTPSFIDFPDVKTIPAANCSGTTAGNSWSLGASGTVTCRAGTNNKGGYVSITDTSTSFAQFTLAIPEDWDTAANPYIRFQVSSADVTTGHTIIPAIQVSCAKGDGTTSDDVTFNASHSLSTITLGTTANQFFSTSNVQMNSTDMTGCSAGSLMVVQVGRATDTATSGNFYGATVTFPRLLTVQAN